MLKNVVYGAGYFKPFQSEFLKSVSSEGKSKFRSLNNVDKVTFVYNVPVVSSFNIHAPFNKKDVVVAEKLKEEGNLKFGKGEFEEALQLYVRCIMTIPLAEGNLHLLAITTANLSAALYRIGHYKQALDAIDNVLKLHYPKDLEYKVKERRARCYEATFQFELAREAFEETLKSLDYAKLSSVKKKQTRNEIHSSLICLIDRKGNNSSDEALSEELVGGSNDKYPSLSTFITIKENAEMGRYAEAERKIKTADVVLTEDAHCAVLLAERRETNCFQCFRRFSVPVPCPNCSAVAFCSDTCREVALESHHKIECGILQTLWDSGASITCLMALRMISQKGLQYFLDVKGSLKQMEENEKYSSCDYRTVYNLVTHTEQRDVVDLLLRTNMAVLLLRCLKMTDFFGCYEDPTPESEFENKLTENEVFIGSLLLHHLELLQFNAHEISEVVVYKDGKPNSVFLGGGLYPTLALFNHSCHPSVVRYFHGTSVAVRAVRELCVGEMVSENYGPIFLQVPKEQRQNTLKHQYWFDCKCLPCTENWPTVSEMNTNILNLKCNANRKCTNVVFVPMEAEICIVQCEKCKGYTNILKSLNALQATDDMYKNADQFAKQGKISLALTQYVKILDILSETLVPPFRDYYLCQESIRHCMMHFGNKYNFSGTKMVNDCM